MASFEDKDGNRRNSMTLTVIVRRPSEFLAKHARFPLKIRHRMKSKLMPIDSSSAPDGGWGWFVILAAHSTLIFREGIAKCLGVFLPTLQTYFSTSTSLIGWISSFCITAADLTGVISGPLCQKLGCRFVAIIGGLFAGAGLIAASFINDVFALCVCLTICGFGLGLALTPSLTMISRYFVLRYSLANGLAYSGSGVGILVLAPVSQILLDTYGWRGAITLIGALCLNVSVCGTMLRPLPSKNDIDHQPLLLADIDERHPGPGFSLLKAEPDAACETIVEHVSICAKISNALEVKMFKNPYFIILLIVQFCSRFTYMGWLIYLIPHAIQRGLTPIEATLVASVAGVSNIISRAFHGIVIDMKILSAIQMLILSCSLAAATMLLDPLMQSYLALMAGSLMYGFAGGIIFPVCVVRMKEVIGVDKLALALGWSYGFAGVGRMLSAFLAGWLFDYFGDYNVSFILLGAVQAIAVALLIGNYMVDRRRRR